LNTDNSCSVADGNWYKEWLKNAPKEYRSPRRTNQYGEMHKYFAPYLEKIKSKNF